jgi:hypothetical protein
MNSKVFRSAVFAFLAVSSAVCPAGPQAFHEDNTFLQDSAEKIPVSEELVGTELFKVRSDRNGRILVLSNKGLLQIHNGRLVPDRQYRPMPDMQIRGLDTYRGQFVYLTDKAVLSNAWAGKFYVPHKTSNARFFKMGNDSDFLLMANDFVAYFHQGKCTYEQQIDAVEVKQLCFDRQHSRFLILCDDRISCFSPGKGMAGVFESPNLNCLELVRDSTAIIIGTEDGFVELDSDSFSQQLSPQQKLPWTDIRSVNQIGEKIWFGTPRGAFALRGKGQIDYYASKRWLVDDDVIDISEGPSDSILILTKGGISIIHFEKMTLRQKADHFGSLTRKRHVRYGLNSVFAMSRAGDLSTGTLMDEDNDGLWTSMYLAGELFRYAVTKSDDALENCYESFEAMERLTYINPLEGFPSRSFERSGYQLADKSYWHPTEDGNWAWKGTTSSDEVVGHFFAYSIFAELIPEKKWRSRAIALMDGITNHIVENDLYLVDCDGRPTLWGRWNPEYVNKFPREVGDRRLNSIEIISFLQTAYNFTRKELYKRKAFELLEKQGYLDNIMTPVTRLQRVEGIDLTTEWNHSDDELAFLCYWNLYKYAFTDELREKYRQAIKDHWEIERPEKSPLWSFIYAMTGAAEFDLEEAIWTLKEFPLDTVGWSVRNSHRRDLDFLESNFREQTIRAVLPPDERPMGKYNANPFSLDGGEGGYQEYSADIFLLPYWMGRYLSLIR